MNCYEAFEGLCLKIVQPSRHLLNEEQLIAQRYRRNRPPYQHFNLRNLRGELLSVIAFLNDPNNLHPTILYLHGNGGYKIECLQLLRPHHNFVAFDFAGCGRSEGKYLSYGDNEVEDIGCVVKQMEGRYGVRKLVIWGRSMGASMAIMYASLSPSQIVCMILDSPFRELRQIVMNVAEHNRQLTPKFILKIVLGMIESKLKQISPNDVFQHDFLKHLNLLSLPIMFVFSAKDTVVKEKDVKELYSPYRGRKELIQIETLHHTDRPQYFIEGAFNFINEESEAQSVRSSMISRKGISLAHRVKLI